MSDFKEGQPNVSDNSNQKENTIEGKPSARGFPRHYAPACRSLPLT